MIRKLSLLLAVVAAIVAASGLRAQVTLGDFGAFQSAGTLFYGGWSLSGDLFVGDTSPVATFSQGAGFYTFADGTNADSAFVDYAFGSAVNLGTSTSLALSLKLLPGNTADQLSVILFNDSGESAAATFLLGGFGSADFSTGTIAFNPTALFDPGSVTYMRLTGNDATAAGTVSVAVSRLAAVSAVPEPGTWAALAGGAALAAALWRRRRLAAG